MRIIKRGDKKPVVVAFDCLNCGCEFECAKDEYEVDFSPSKNVLYKTTCPCCNRTVYRLAETVEDEEIEKTFTKDNPPDFPDDFFHFANNSTAKIEDNAVNYWIDLGIQFFKENPEENLFTMACGDTIVFMSNLEDGVHIYVCKNYYAADIEPE